MPTLANPKHELFAQERAKGKTADEAYVLAGYKPDRGHASRLAANGNVIDRIAELLSAVAKRTEVTVQSLIEEAEDARRLAMGTLQPSAAVSALITKAKLAGLWVEKTDNTNVNRNDNPRTLSDEELMRVAASGSAGVAASQSSPSKLN